MLGLEVINLFLLLAWQAIVSSPEVTKASKQQIMGTEHLMKALLEQKNGFARRIFSKAGVDNTRLLEATERFIQRQPKIGSLLSMYGCYILYGPEKMRSGRDPDPDPLLTLSGEPDEGCFPSSSSHSSPSVVVHTEREIHAEEKRKTEVEQAVAATEVAAAAALVLR
ncbi:Chaperone protein [Nymphaea thermarum]|nr:Chaperone protein [Nymphaea thermarum]